MSIRWAKAKTGGVSGSRTYGGMRARNNSRIIGHTGGGRRLTRGKNDRSDAECGRETPRNALLNQVLRWCRTPVAVCRIARSPSLRHSTTSNEPSHPHCLELLLRRRPVRLCCGDCRPHHASDSCPRPLTTSRVQSESKRARQDLSSCRLPRGDTRVSEIGVRAGTATMPAYADR